MAALWTPEATFPAVEWQSVSWRPAAAVEPLRLPLTDLFEPI